VGAPKSERIRHSIAAYDRTLHEGFVLASWCKGARQPWAELSRLLRRPETCAVVAHVPDCPDDLLGWAATTRGALVWVYARNLHGKVRLRGLGASLLHAAGVDPLSPLPCLYWSPSAAEIAAAGAWRIYHQPFTRKEIAA
jgi:hypothetical protein